MQVTPDFTTRIRRPWVIASLVALFLAAFLPQQSRAQTIGTVASGGYIFTNFNFPNAGTNATAGTNSNGIANTGSAVGFSIGNTGNLFNYVRNPNGSVTALNINGSTSAMALGINSAGTVVGTDGSGHAFVLPAGGAVQTFIPGGGSSATALGINDGGNIVGQFTSGTTTPGFSISNSAGNNFVQINAPSGPNTVNAQGINDHGQIVGFYVGTDAQDHGFEAQIASASGGDIAGTPISDPVIPNVPGEPGATFVFSQVLGVNDHDIAVGYYGDSTTSQHGFFYNLTTGTYTFLDDPSEAFSNGVEVTQITGINNLGDITGFYSDASGVFHGFVATPTVATPTPEPASLLLLGTGLLGMAMLVWKRQHATRRA